MRRHLILLASALLSIGTISAYDFTVDGIFYNRLGGDSAEVTSGYSEYSGTVTIPSSATDSGTTYRVTSIGERAFFECSGLTSVTLPGSVSSIGVRAFYGCPGLTSITIPGSVSSIGGYAFCECSGLTSVTIPEGVTSMGDGAFSSCYGLTSVTIPEGVTSMGDGAFSSCYGLTSVTISEGVTAISFQAFSDCYGLTSVSIPGSVKTIGYYAFANCIGLTSITIPEGVTSIQDGAFVGCSSLTSVTLPEGITTINDETFSECTALTSVTLPRSVTSIGRQVFSGCTSLNEIYCYASIPPTADDDCFSYEGVYTTTLYVPVRSVDSYKEALGWRYFPYIEPIGATSTTDAIEETVTVVSGDSAATFTWPTSASAASYTLMITKGGETVCSLTFNADGRLTAFAFAPSKDGTRHAPAAELSVAGMTFEVTGLD